MIRPAESVRNFLKRKRTKITTMDRHQKKHNTSGNHDGNMDSGDIRPSGRLSAYPDGNLDKETLPVENLTDKETDDRRPHGRTIQEATDPSKLSDI
jgi:hypothetical protein